MSAQKMTSADVYAALLERQGEQWVQPRIDRTRRVLELLDDPQRTFRVVHVTGTNGKTSTSRIVESLLRAHALRTGLFTSPHLESFTERIVVDGEPIEEAAIVEAWQEIAPIVQLIDAELVGAGDAPLTYFELLTVLAFVAFADAPVDVAVIEVGMGGTWDSTNTADGDVAVITPVGVDHVDRLGSTPEQIAGVKAGIIKQGARVVSAQQEPGVLDVLRAKAREMDAEFALEGQDFALTQDRLAVGGQVVSVQGLAGSYEEEFLPLYGAHQGHNAALALAAVEALIGDGGQRIAADVVTEGLSSVTSPGRLELVGIAPSVVVDAAHNPHGMAALATALQEVFDFDEWGVVLGVLSDKDVSGIVAQIAPVAAHVFATTPDSDRAADVDALAEVVELAGSNVSVHPDLEDAAQAARNWAAEGERRAVVITGSIVLAGEAVALARDEGWKP